MNTKSQTNTCRSSKFLSRKARVFENSSTITRSRSPRNHEFWWKRSSKSISNNTTASKTLNSQQFSPESDNGQWTYLRLPRDHTNTIFTTLKLFISNEWPNMNSNFHRTILPRIKSFHRKLSPARLFAAGRRKSQKRKGSGKNVCLWVGKTVSQEVESKFRNLKLMLQLYTVKERDWRNAKKLL